MQDEAIEKWFQVDVSVQRNAEVGVNTTMKG